MPDDPDPPRKFYTMKAKEIERLNPARGESAKTGAISVHDHLAQAAKTSAPRPSPTPASAPAAPNDVVALVQANAVKETAAGLHDVALDRPKKPSRKKRDYLFTLAVGNSLIIGLTVIVGFNVMTLVFSLSGLILFNASTTWIIWQVMDDY